MLAPITVFGATRSVDVATVKMTFVSEVTAGQLVAFGVDVQNQGDVPLQTDVSLAVCCFPAGTPVFGPQTTTVKIAKGATATVFFGLWDTFGVPAGCYDVLSAASPSDRGHSDLDPTDNTMESFCVAGGGITVA